MQKRTWKEWRNAAVSVCYHGAGRILCCLSVGPHGCRCENIDLLVGRWLVIWMIEDWVTADWGGSVRSAQ